MGQFAQRGCVLAQRVSGRALLSRLNAEDISKLLAISDSIEYGGDDVILDAGAKSEQFCVLMHGTVAVELVHPAFSLCVETLEAGDAFGWSSLVRGSEALFRVRAREDCRIACMEGARLLDLCQAEPDFGVRLLLQALDIAARRVRGTELRLSELCRVCP